MSSGCKFEGRMNLLDLLVTKQGSEASGSRDIVFALSRTAKKPRLCDLLSITYEKSLSLGFIE